MSGEVSPGRSISLDVSPIRERAGDVGLGTGEMLFSWGSGVVFSWMVGQAAQRAQSAALEVLREPRTFGDSEGVQFRCTLGNFIKEEHITNAINFCEKSGHSAVMTVGVVETITQIWRLAQKDQGPWALDILSGSYRGAALGASAGLWESWSGNLGEKTLAVLVGSLFGSVLGAGIAGCGATARKISTNVQDSPSEEPEQIPR